MKNIIKVICELVLGVVITLTLFALIAVSLVVIFMIAIRDAIKEKEPLILFTASIDRINQFYKYCSRICIREFEERSAQEA